MLRPNDEAKLVKAEGRYVELEALLADEKPGAGLARLGVRCLHSLLRDHADIRWYPPSIGRTIYSSRSDQTSQ